ncbi:MAG: glycerol-3-phosphate 1-O-acyltransferase PlsY [Opitutales bacterium]|nr:glycerol-3-phosphate 1-O-acyltransferase PlsY [Opitutales bacterium]
MSVSYLFISLAVGYLLGAIPFAVIIASAKGVDILSYGSGNPGATNVKRACGTFAGRLCFVCDALKGFIAAFWPYAAAYFGCAFGGMALVNVALFGLVGAIIGHTFSVFLKFKGGKGVSVTIGALCAVLPYPILIGLILWLIFFYSSKMVSLASIAMAFSLPFSCIFFYGIGSAQFYVALALGAFVIYRHKSNIKRILNGTEYKFTKKQ